MIRLHDTDTDVTLISIHTEVSNTEVGCCFTKLLEVLCFQLKVDYLIWKVRIILRGRTTTDDLRIAQHIGCFALIDTFEDLAFVEKII